MKFLVSPCSKWMAAIALLATGSLAIAQFSTVGPVKGVMFPYFYPLAPGATTNKIKTLMTAGEAWPQTNGQFLFKEVRIENFQTNGISELVIRSPECTFEMSSQNASGPGRLELQTTDGRLYIEGEGFFWHQTNGSLVISNRVKTLIRKDLVMGPWKKTK